MLAFMEAASQDPEVKQQPNAPPRFRRALKGRIWFRAAAQCAMVSGGRISLDAITPTNDHTHHLAGLRLVRRPPAGGVCGIFTM